MSKQIEEQIAILRQEIAFLAHQLRIQTLLIDRLVREGRPASGPDTDAD